MLHSWAQIFEASGRSDKAWRAPGMFTLHYYANAKIIKQSGLLFLMFITAVYVNNVTRAWTFIRAVSSTLRATFADRMLSAVPLYPRAVWSNQRRAALIAWPWQEARWSGIGHHLPGERSALILSLCPSYPPFFAFTLCHKQAPGSYGSFSRGVMQSHPSQMRLLLSKQPCI